MNFWHAYLLRCGHGRKEIIVVELGGIMRIRINNGAISETLILHEIYGRLKSKNKRCNR